MGQAHRRPFVSTGFPVPTYSKTLSQGAHVLASDLGTLRTVCRQVAGPPGPSQEDLEECFMRAFRFLNLAILSMLVASSAVLYAQDEKQQEQKPPRQEEPKRQEDAKPASRQDEMKPPRQEEAKPPSKQDEMRPPGQEEAKPPQQDKQEQKRDEKQPREQMNTREMNNERQETAPHQEGHARPAGQSAHIPGETMCSRCSVQ